jgi:hypothetical protein
VDQPEPQHEHGPPADEWLVAAPRDKRDRWAHRRGEPRVWALVWSCYLLSACVLALFTPASRWSFDLQQIRHSCVLLLALIQLGVVVVWPLLRLSQIPPRVPSRAAAVDLLIVLAPSAAILGPMGFLTKWSGATVAVLCASLIAWTVLYAGIIALAARVRSSTARASWMLLCLALAAGGPLFGLLSNWRAGGAVSPEVWRGSLLASPVTAPFAIARHPDPRVPTPDALAWEFALLPLFIASVLWLIAIVLDLIRSTPDTPAARSGRPTSRAGAG